MSKYIVLYRYTFEVDVPANRDQIFMRPASKRSQGAISFKSFDDISEAYKFSIKNNGEIIATADLDVNIKEETK